MNETISKRERRPLEDLNLTDDFLFGEVMSDKKTCQQLLEHLLDVKIASIDYLATQFTDEVVYGAHGIRLDVYLKDDTGRVFTVEMQTRNNYNEGRRSRYYHSLVDADHVLKKGVDYRKLPDNFVIFICSFDPFGEDKYVYRFSTLCKDDPTVCLNDGSYTVVLNTKGKDDTVDEEIKNFLKYVENSTTKVAQESGSDWIKALDHQVMRVKVDRETRLKYMKLHLLLQEKMEDGMAAGLEEGLAEGRAIGLEEGRAEGLEEGRAEGLEEGRAAGLEEGRRSAFLEMVKQGLLSPSDAAKALDISVEELLAETKTDE